MLSDEERRRIETEELAAARALEEREERARHQLARHAYRREVRAALRPPKSPWWLPVRWALPFLPVIAAVVFLRPVPAVNDDTTGGISNSALMDRCRAEVGARLGQADLRYPEGREAAGQFSASADGKRWDGWVSWPGHGPTDFSCSFTAADGTVQVELIQEDSP
ncbi:hypothetical protein DAETH_05650 [Deinococcus aetherius]|uniref:Uncharacterized protein n=1 Tax=Deinococcus aetherius TaxID=200252 RepID=A0ABN6REH8_9DEIO|nr:hypothetical protein [Deinococcus aetherius]BDP40596.1 hypothetical protein DAETH_05650 [Deinococcus aetherius]